MADQLEGARTLPVKFIDQGDGSTAERLALPATHQTRLDLLATEAKAEAIRALLASSLTVGLPSGASTEANQATQQTQLNLLATEAKLEAVRAALAGTLTVDSELPAASANVDGITPGSSPNVGAVSYLYNGATLDLERSNSEFIEVVASTTRSANTTGPTQTNYGYTGLLYVVNVSVVGASGSITPRLVFNNPGSSPAFAQTRFFQASTPITAVGNYAYLIDPRVAERQNLTAAYLREAFSTSLPRKVIPYMAHVGTEPWTYYAYFAWLR